jgi:hypothetical protein
VLYLILRYDVDDEFDVAIYDDDDDDDGDIYDDDDGYLR